MALAGPRPLDPQIRGRGSRRTVELFCIYQARDAESIREPARSGGMSGTEIFPVVDIIVIRDDPSEQTPLT